MIFATVGTQLPFPRLIDALDRLAIRHSLQIVAQTGDPGARPAHLEAHVQLEPRQFDEYIKACELIVGHAGIGTVLKAGKLGKPLILYPRRASLGEHRNDHQMATAMALRGRSGIRIATSEDELEALLLDPGLEPVRLGVSPSRDALLERIRAFIEG